MSGNRIGERLSRVTHISGHDIEEILSEQKSTGLRFGEIALQMGLCSPEDVVRAWSNQLDDSPQRINLDHFGIDSQAVATLPAEMAVHYHIMPVRILEDRLVVAVDEAASAA
jgi:type IV pilus assembly protein PilB